MTMTICVQCACSIARDAITGEEIQALGDGVLVCGHPDSSIDPVTGSPLGDLPLCRAINRGNCPSFIPAAERSRFVRVETAAKVAPADSTPPHLRTAKEAPDATKR